MSSREAAKRAVGGSQGRCESRTFDAPVVPGGKFIPYRLGIDEMGSGSVSQLLGLGTSAGVTLALVRRARILALNAVGIGLLARDRRH